MQLLLQSAPGKAWTSGGCETLPYTRVRPALRRTTQKSCGDSAPMQCASSPQIALETRSRCDLDVVDPGVDFRWAGTIVWCCLCVKCGLCSLVGCVSAKNALVSWASLVWLERALTNGILDSLPPLPHRRSLEERQQSASWPTLVTLFLSRNRKNSLQSDPVLLKCFTLRTVFPGNRN